MEMEGEREVFFLLLGKNTVIVCMNKQKIKEPNFSAGIREFSMVFHGKK